ncbi:MAG: thermonuclease family protein [Actinobacteria bacterium]|nr:thermonuclease family protein [Actinomycetota bacterium]
MIPGSSHIARAALVAAAALGACAIGIAPAHAAPSVVLRGTVTKVVDGDTIKFQARGFESTMRLIGIDTPETKRPGYPVQCGGPAASAETARLLPVGTAIRVESDPSQDARDKYDRFLGYVYVGSRGGARRSVNYRLVRTGFAKTYVYGEIPFRYAGAFLGAEIRAKKSRIGVWGPPCNGDTTKPQYGGGSSAGAGAGSAAGSASGRCDPNYSGACIPSPPPDLDCSDITARRFRVVGTDVHRFDSDGDAIACEGARR